jgi:GT2 family glycosyltransferase
VSARAAPGERASQARAELLAFGASLAPRAPEGPWVRELTAVVKTFERPCCVVRFLRSLREQHPTLGVLVCDDSREPLFADRSEPLPGVTWLVLPFEAGHTLGAGRNHLVANVKTPFLFLSDDDHVLTPGTRLREMLDFLKEHGYDLVGCAQGRRGYGAASFEQRGDVVYQHFGRHRGLVTPGVVRCDRVSNVFVARTEALRRVLWEDRVYANEHADFFLRATREGLRIAQMGGAFVEHDRSCEAPSGWLSRLFGPLLSHRDGRYRALRLGRGEGSDGSPARRARELYRRHVLEKNGIRAIVDVNRRSERRALEQLIGPPVG